MDTLLSVVLCNAVGATLLAVPAAALGWLRRWPALAHSLWLLVLLKLIAPPLYVLPLPFPPGANPTRTEDAGDIRVPFEPRAEAPEEADALPRVVLGMPSAELSDPGTAPPSETPPETDAPEFSWKSAVVLSWLAGSQLWWSVLVLRVRNFRRVLRRVQPAPEALQALTDRLSRLLGLKRPPEVGFIAAPISPLVWGLSLRPRLLLPAALWERLSEEQRETLLVHELAHLRRRDHWVRVLELAVLGLYWWHPVVWWARNRLQQAEEQCCDAWVVWALPGKAEAYAAALLETVAFLSQTRSALPVAASGIGRVRFLKRRLTMILRDKAPRGLTWGGLTAVLLLAAFLLPLMAAPSQEGAQQPPAVETRDGPAAPRQETRTTTRPTVGVEKPANPTQTVPPHTDNKPSYLGPDHPALGPELQKLRDQIELMEAQLRVKQLQVEAARKKLEHAKKDLSRAQNLAGNRAISAEDLDRVQQKVDDQELELRVKEAEMLEPSVLLQQARRRLAALEGRQTAPDVPAKGRSRSEEKALFPQSSVDFGRVPQGPRVVHNFRAVNNSKVKVRFRSVRVSSAGVTATAAPAELAPGESGQITVTVDTRRFTGPKVFTVFLTVEMQGPRDAAVTEGQTKLTVRADSQPTVSSSDFKPSQNTRIRDMEEKIDRLLKELDELRRDLKDRPPSRTQSREDFEAIDPTVRDVAPQWLAIPFQIDESQKSRIARVVLHCSRDEGHTWKAVAEAPPSQGRFQFQATKGGSHWFAVGLLYQDGSRKPADPLNLRPTLKVNLKKTP